MEPIDILMVKRDGRFSGEAFVVLSTAPQVDAAIAKHKMYLGSRFVEVFVARKMVGGICGDRRACRFLKQVFGANDGWAHPDRARSPGQARYLGRDALHTWWHWGLGTSLRYPGTVLGA